MNIDLVLAIIAALALLYGLYRGFIAQLASVGGFILGIVACRIFSSQAGEAVIALFPSMADSKTVATGIGCVALYLIVYFFISAFARLIRHLTHAMHVGWLDRLAGGLVCVLKWMFLCSILLNLWYYIAPESKIFTGAHLMEGRPLELVMRISPKVLGTIEQFAAPDC